MVTALPAPCCNRFSFSLSDFFKPELPFSFLSVPPFSPSPQLGPRMWPFGDSLVPDMFLCECRHAARPGPSLEQSSPSAWGCASCPLPELTLRPPSLVHSPGVTPRGVPALGTHADGCLRGHRGRSSRAGALPVCALCSVHACSLFLCGGFREGCWCHCRCHCWCHCRRSPPRLVAPPGRSFSSLPPPPPPPRKDSLTVFPPEGNPSPHGSLTASHFVPQPGAGSCSAQPRVLPGAAAPPALCQGTDISPGQQHGAATEVLFPWLGAAAGDEPSSPHGFLEGAGLLSAGSPTRLGARMQIYISL